MPKNIEEFLNLLIMAGVVSACAMAAPVAFAEAPARTDAACKEQPLAPVMLFEEHARPEVAQGADAGTPSPVEPEPEELVTSRPSFGDAPKTVPRGSLQVETGATYYDHPDGLEEWTLPESLFRLGVGKNTEVRFTAPDYRYLGDDDAGTQINNFDDISVGLGQHFELPKKIDLAVYPILNIPTGANNVSSNALDPEVRVVIAKELTDKLEMDAMMASRWTNSRGASQNAILNPTISVNYKWTDRLTGFLEYAGFIPVGARKSDPDDEHYVHTGLMYKFKERHQIDVHVAAGLNRTAPDFLVGVGYSFRIDHLF